MLDHTFRFHGLYKCITLICMVLLVFGNLSFVLSQDDAAATGAHPDAAAQAKLHEAERQLQAERARVEALEAKANAALERARELEDQSGRLAQDSTAMQSDLDNAQTTLKQTRESVTELQTDLAKSKYDLDAAIAAQSASLQRAETAEGDKAALASAVEELRAQHDELQKRLHTESQNLQADKARVDVAEAKVRDLESQLEEQRKSSESALKDLEEQLKVEKASGFVNQAQRRAGEALVSAMGTLQSTLVQANVEMEHISGILQSTIDLASNEAAADLSNIIGHFEDAVSQQKAVLPIASGALATVLSLLRRFASSTRLEVPFVEAWIEDGCKHVPVLAPHMQFLVDASAYGLILVPIVGGSLVWVQSVADRQGAAILSWKVQRVAWIFLAIAAFVSRSAGLRSASEALVVYFGGSASVLAHALLGLAYGLSACCLSWSLVVNLVNGRSSMFVVVQTALVLYTLYGFVSTILTPMMLSGATQWQPSAIIVRWHLFKVTVTAFVCWLLTSWPRRVLLSPSRLHHELAGPPQPLRGPDPLDPKGDLYDIARDPMSGNEFPSPLRRRH